MRLRRHIRTRAGLLASTRSLNVFSQTNGSDLNTVTGNAFRKARTRTGQALSISLTSGSSDVWSGNNLARPQCQRNLSTPEQLLQSRATRM